MPTNYENLSDREKIEIIERNWYAEAQAFIDADTTEDYKESAKRSDMLLDAYLSIAEDLGGLVCEAELRTA